MSVIMVRQKVKEGSLDEAESAVRDLFAKSIAWVPRACVTRRRGWSTARRS
jgi:hypothetical protein